MLAFADDGRIHRRADGASALGEGLRGDRSAGAADLYEQVARGPRGGGFVAIARAVPQGAIEWATMADRELAALIANVRALRTATA